MTRIDAYILYTGHDLHGLLDTAGIAPGPDVVGRVRVLAEQRASLRSANDGIATAYSRVCEENSDLERRLEAVTSDRDNLVKTLETVRGERDALSLAAQKCHTALTKAGVRQGDLNDRVGSLIADARILSLSNESYRNDIAKLRTDLSAIADAVGWRMDDDCTPLEMARRVREEHDALRPKPAGPVVEWRGLADIFVNGKLFAWVSERDCGYHVRRNCETIGIGDDEPSARRLAELLAGHNPGGRWTVAGHTVPVDVVRAVCGSVAVGWEAA